MEYNHSERTLSSSSGSTISEEPLTVVRNDKSLTAIMDSDISTPVTDQCILENNEHDDSDSIDSVESIIKPSPEPSCILTNVPAINNFVQCPCCDSEMTIGHICVIEESTPDILDNVHLTESSAPPPNNPPEAELYRHRPDRPDDYPVLTRILENPESRRQIVDECTTQ